jgi:predicted esterase
MKHSAIFLSLAATIALAYGCSSDPASTTIAGSASGSSSGAAAGGDGGTAGAGQGGAGGASSSSSSSSSSSGQGGVGNNPPVPGNVTCSDKPPEGAKLAPDPKKYSGGTCPMLVDGHNPFQSGAAMRDFRLVLPVDMKADERFPVIFLWHWLGGSADDFYDKGQIQLAADTQRFIAVIPESKGDLFKWPFEVTQTQGRMDEEFVFFDDMLACVSEQFNVNKECVGSAGVSAGALFTGQLAGFRGDYLSSIVSLSGGTGGSLIKPFANPEHRMPAVVLWGGPTDNCFGVMNFVQTSQDLEKNLESREHFFIECVHNCGHAEPPLDAQPGLSTYAPMWQFVLDHPYWLLPGQSPYATEWPTAMPEWCAIGAGSATPRTGTCPGSPGC